MDLDQISCFLSVAELGSFSEAAHRHFITQPAVSFRLKALEQSVGERLIERRRGHVRLTAAGEIFRARCAEAVRAFELGLAEVSDLKGLKRGRLGIGSIDAAGIDLLPRLLRRYHARHPEVELVIRVEPSAPLIEALVAGRIDAAIITLPPGRRDLVVTDLEEETMVLVAPGPAADPAAALLKTMPLIAYPRGSVTRGLIDQALAALRLAPRVAMELSHPEAIRGLVEAGLGVAVLPRKVAARGRPAVRIVPGFKVRRRLGLAVRRGERPSSALKAFVGLIGRRRPAGILGT